MRKQLFGWTQIEQAPPGKYVKFMAVFEEEDHKFTFTIRDDNCVFTSMVLPWEAVAALIKSLGGVI